MGSLVKVDDYPEFVDLNPQPFLCLSTSSAGSKGCVLELGRFYWVHRHWGNHTITRVRFLKITPKGYAFMTMDAKRLFKRPLYPDKVHWNHHKELMFFLNGDMTIYKEGNDTDPQPQKIPFVSKEAFDQRFIRFSRAKAARKAAMDRVA